ncbi:MAG TPA: addiction module protein [Longimicrobiaceae bacterium]
MSNEPELGEHDEVLRAWADEAERRLEELRSGAVKGIPAEAVLARVQARPRPGTSEPDEPIV